MINQLSFDVEDWFQVENLRAAIPRDQWPSMEYRVEASTARVLEILDSTSTKATFFVLGWVAERSPQLIREIVGAGHEIGCHGYGHELVYNMARDSFKKDVLTAKAIIENVGGKAVRGYRAPSFSITADSTWAIDILRDCGFSYDSSVFPMSLHNRYGYTAMGLDPFYWPNGLYEVPLAVCEFAGMRLPAAGGGYFRILPIATSRHLLDRINAVGRSASMYFHPWEFDPGQPRVEVPLALRFRHYFNLEKMESRLRSILKQYEFQPYERLLRPTIGALNA